MTTINFYKQTNMAVAQTSYGYITGLTPTQITVTDGYNTSLYFGYFSYSETNVYGTLTGYELFSGGSPNYLVSGANVNATTAASLVLSNRLQSLFSLALQGNNIIYGSSSNDVILTYDGNAQVFGGGGTDVINGGSGFDALMLHGNRADYRITYQPGASVTVADTMAGRDGTATLSNFSYLKFADQGIVLTTSATSDAAEIALLYRAALGRSPDQTGLTGWVNAYTHNVSGELKAQGPVVALAQVSGGYNGSQSIASGFVHSAEFVKNTGQMGNGDFVTMLYHNVLGRDPDAAGYAGWVNALNTGIWSKEMVLVGFSSSTENFTHAQAQGWLMLV